jgi:ATP-dependent Clp protease ATP-binding subunit ClpB
VSDHFRPEFINRVDDMVVFHPLTREQIRLIADIQLKGLRQRLAERELTLDVSAEAMDLLADAGFDPVYGARPLKRAIQQRLENPLAEALLSGKFDSGMNIRVVVSDGELVFSNGS